MLHCILIKKPVMADNHYMDELARQHLSGYKADFEPADWAAMETMLNKKRNRRGIIWWPLSGAAAALLVWTALHLQQSTPIATLPVAPEPAASILPAVHEQDAVDVPAQDISTGNNFTISASNPAPATVPTIIAGGGTSGKVSQQPSAVDGGGTSGNTGATAASPGQSGNQPVIQEPELRGDSRIVVQEYMGGERREEVLAILSDLTYMEKAGLTTTDLSMPLSDNWLIGSRNWSPKVSGVQWLAGVYGQAELQQVTNLAVGGGQGIWIGMATHSGWQISTGLGTQTMRYDEPGSMDTIDGRIHLNTRGTLTYLDIPVQVQYLLPLSRRWVAYGGVALHSWHMQRQAYVLNYRDVSTFPTTMASALYEYTIQLSGIPEDASFATSNSILSDFTQNTKEGYVPGGIVWATAISGGIGYLLHPRMHLQAGFRYQAPLQPLGIEQKKFRSGGLSATIRYRLR